MQQIVSKFRHFFLFSVVNLRYYWWFYLFISIGIIFSVSMVSYFQVLAQPNETLNAMKWVFWFLINLGIANITGSGLGMYSKKNNRIHLLTLPVSPVMRLFSLVFFSIILPFIVFTTIYTATANMLAGIYTAMDFTDSFSFSFFQLDHIGMNFFIFMIIQSVLLMIGSFFTKVGIVKTILCVIAFILIILIIDSITASYRVDKSIFMNLFMILNTDNNAGKNLVSEMPSFVLIIRYMVGFSLIPVSMYIVYLRLKELEV